MDSGLLNNLILLAIAIINAYGYYMTHTTAKKQVAALDEVKNNVATIEEATNSMKDQLVNAASKAAKAEGVLLGRAQVKDAIVTIDPKVAKAII